MIQTCLNMITFTYVLMHFLLVSTVFETSLNNKRRIGIDVRKYILLCNKDYMCFWTLGLDSTQTLRLWWERENRANHLLSGSRITHSTSSQISYKHCDTTTSTLLSPSGDLGIGLV